MATNLDYKQSSTHLRLSILKLLAPLTTILSKFALNCGPRSNLILFIIIEKKEGFNVDSLKYVSNDNTCLFAVVLMLVQ